MYMQNYIYMSITKNQKHLFIKIYLDNTLYFINEQISLPFY